MVINQILGKFINIPPRRRTPTKDHEGQHDFAFEREESIIATASSSTLDAAVAYHIQLRPVQSRAGDLRAEIMQSAGGMAESFSRVWLLSFINALDV